MAEASAHATNHLSTEAQEKFALFYLVPSQDQEKSTWLQANTP